jgi:hypothetical protein
MYFHVLCNVMFVCGKAGLNLIDDIYYCRDWLKAPDYFAFLV